MPINHSVADLAALTAVPASAVRVDSYLLLVLDPSPIGSVDTVKPAPAWYVYRAASTANALEALCLVPDDAPATGRWMKTSDLVHRATAAPTGIPPMSGITWIATLTNPNRTVIYTSTGSSTWETAKEQPMIYSTDPSDTPAFFDISPDFLGQLWFIQGDTLGPTPHKLYVGGSIGTGADAWIEISSATAIAPY